MNNEERAQLIEDIRKSSTVRANIVEQATLSKDFDIAAAWEELDELDTSINDRVTKARLKE
jgi:hypothetical protein